MKARARIYGSVVLDQQTRTWRITTTADCATRLKRVFPRIDPGAQGTLPLADNPRNCEELLWALARYPHEIATEDRAYLERRAEGVVEQEGLVDKILAAGYAPPTFPLLKPLRHYQAVAVDLCLQSGALLVADDTGLGKTVQGIGLYSNPEARPAVVICPVQLQTQWAEKTSEFLGDGVLVHNIEKMAPYDLVAKCGRIPDLIIITYSKLRGWAQHLSEIVKSVIADEAQEFRHHETQKYEAICYLRDRASYVMFLSATPIYNWGGETHTVVSAMREDALGTRDEFCREFCDGATGSKAKVADPVALNAHLKREGLMIRRSRADVGRELPRVNSIVHVIDSAGKALAEEEANIARLAEVLCAEGGRGIDKMQAAGEFNMKLRQATGIDKAGFAAEFIRMLCAEGQKILAFAWHRSVYDILLEKLGPGQKDGDEELPDLHPVMFTGSETRKQKDAARDRFVKGDAQVMLISLRAGAGIDGLQDVCATTVHVELDWSPGVMKQNVDRINRDGQPNPVFAYVLLSDEGSDPVIADILGAKSGQFDAIFNGADGDVDLAAEMPADRVKLVAQKFLEQQKAKKARPAEAPNPRANAPANLRPDVSVASPRGPALVTKPPTPKAPPPPKVERWVELPAKSVTPQVEKMLIEAGIGLTAADVDRIRRRHERARVGFGAGGKIVAIQRNAI